MIARKIGSFAALLLTASLLTVAHPTRADGDGVSRSSGSFSVVYFDAATGENVDIAVTYDTDQHIVIDSGGSFHVAIHNVYSGRGTGETTGVAYIANQTDSSVALGGSGTVEYTAPVHFSLISKGALDNLEVSGLQHITVNANGVATSIIDNFSVKSVGK